MLFKKKENEKDLKNKKPLDFRKFQEFGKVLH